MSDPASTARSARESLARGLAALQSDPNVPPQLVELAAPIAQSMGALHQIERSNGTQLLPHANIALENVRMALAKLQSQPSTHPAVAIAMESVASSLGLVHALSRLAGGGAPQPQAAAPQPQAAPQPYAQPYQQQQQQQHQQQQPQQQGGFVQQQRANIAPMAQTVAAPQSAGFAPTAPGTPMHHAPAPMHAAPMHAAPMQAAPMHAAPMQQGAPMHAAPAAAPQRAPAPAPAPAGGGGGGGFARDPFAPGGGAPAAGDDKLVITADLGAQSPTNFYKGLSGNDIVDHGGLFVSTYMIPKIGTPVRLKVSLPGGYEFEADAVVRWARDVRDASSDAPPGFGAQLTGVTQEARQLIYRYVRNREPLFHDDL